MTETGIVPLYFDSQMLAVEQQFAAWQTGLRNLTLSRDYDGPFAATARIYALDAMMLTHNHVDPVCYERPETRIRGDPTGPIVLSYLFSGSFCGTFDGRHVDAGAGSLTAIDPGRPFRTDAGRMESVMLIVPRAHLAERLAHETDLHGLVVEGPMTALLGTMLRTVLMLLPTIDPAQAPCLSAMIRDLAAGALGGAARDPVRTARCDAPLRARIVAYIDDHLTDALGVASICAALGISRSALYRALRGSGGVVQMVQRRRLSHLRRLLADPAETRTIAELALLFRFSDKSHLSRIFRRAYGTTPGDYRARRARTPRPDNAPRDVPGLYRNWADLLG